MSEIVDQKDKTWKIDPEAHYRMKNLCSRYGLKTYELATRALDAYEKSLVTSTEGQSTPGTGNNRLRANEAKYSKALAKIGLIVREVLSAQGQTAANAKSQISKTKKRTPSLAKTNRMLDEIKGGAPKDSGATGKTGGIAS